MELKTTRWEVADGVATLTLTRPGSHNAWTGRMHSELRHLLDAAESDRTVRSWSSPAIRPGCLLPRRRHPGARRPRRSAAATTRGHPPTSPTPATECIRGSTPTSPTSTRSRRRRSPR
ncbi:MAG: hypothetical protein R2695_06450 [Acidimicrobiales bacterium]